MSMTIYQVDAFTSTIFKGNPAAVCILDEWFEDAVMQSIARENNLSETAFAVKVEDHYEIRWFTPETEVDLCGHATLATAHVLFEHLDHPHDKIEFHSLYSGILSVSRSGEKLTLDFPVDTLDEIEIPELAFAALNIPPIKAYKGKSDYMFIYDTQSEIEKIRPDFEELKQLGGRGVIITAMGDEVDFVSRFFAPQAGIAEDPVTGSAHTTLTPYWSKKLEKRSLTAKQLSKRGGDLWCEDRGERVSISGQAVTYLIGKICL